MAEEKTQHQKVKFDMTINLGHVLSLLAFLGSMVMVWVNFNTRQTSSEKDIQFLQKQNGDVMSAITKLQESNSMNSLTMMRITTVIETMQEAKKPERQ